LHEKAQYVLYGNTASSLHLWGEVSPNSPALWFRSGYQPSMTEEQCCPNGKVAFPLPYCSSNRDVIMSCD